MTTIERFAAEYQAVERISPLRARTQILALQHFERFLDRSIDTTTADDLRRWLAHRSENLAPTGVGAEYHLILGCLRWMWRVRIFEAERWLALSEVKPPRGSTAKGRPRPYSRKELDQFYVELDEKFPYGRDYFITRFKRGTSPYKRVYHHSKRLQIDAILGLALYQGLRRNEIFSVSIDDVHPDNSYVVVEAGKRADWRPKPREVPYSDIARQAVARWFAWRRVLGPPHDEPWLSLSHKPSDRLMPFPWDSFRIAFASIGSGWELHRLRHTCATERLRAGMPIEKLQKFLGHASIQQTLRYAELVSTDVAEAVSATDDAFDRRVRARAA